VVPLRRTFIPRRHHATRRADPIQPIQPSYSELYLVMSFFVGVPGSPSTGHDELAREIAENGRKFTLEHWRWEDMQSYMFRLLLE